MTRFAYMIFALVPLIASCASSPVPDFYLLSADAPAANVRSDDIQLGIATVEVASYLDRPQLVTLDSNNRLRIHDYERWAEPVRDGIRRVLVLNLGELLASSRIRSMPWPRSEQPDWIVRCDVERLDVTADRIVLVAAWRVERTSTGLLMHTEMSRIEFERDSPALDNIASDVSALLLTLSEDIADAIKRLSTDDGANLSH